MDTLTRADHFIRAVRMCGTIEELDGCVHMRAELHGRGLDDAMGQAEREAVALRRAELQVAQVRA